MHANYISHALQSCHLLFQQIHFVQHMLLARRHIKPNGHSIELDYTTGHRGEFTVRYTSINDSILIGQPLNDARDVILSPNGIRMLLDLKFAKVQ